MLRIGSAKYDSSYKTPSDVYSDEAKFYYNNYRTYLNDIKRARRGLEHNWYGEGCGVARERVC